MKGCNEQHPTDSTCAIFIFSLRIFGRKGMIVQRKKNVTEIFTHSTVSIARHVSNIMAAD